MKRFQPLLLATIAAISAASMLPAAQSTKEKEKKYELPKTGVNVARSGGWINVVVEGNRFVVTFYDAKKKPAAADARHGTVRYVYAAKNPSRVVLNLREDGAALVSPPTVRPPHVFKLFLSLDAQEGEEPAETYSVGYPSG